MDKISHFLEAINKNNISKQAFIEAIEQLSRSFPSNSEDCDREILTQIENHLRPVFLESPCLKHAFRKPYGYAGDYYMMYLIHSNNPTGNGLGKLFDAVFLESITCQSVRERSNIFVNSINDLIIANDNRLEALIVGCGPCYELLNFFKKNVDSSGALSFTCLDHDSKAVNFAQELLVGTSAGNNVRYICSNIFRYATDKKYDFIYSAGVFDYLRESLFKKLLSRLLDLLANEGMMVIGNLSNKMPIIDIFTMEYILDWKIHRRDKSTMKNLVPDLDSDCIETMVDCHGIGNYLIIKKLNR
ncbi:MAG: class I SAM-dependent methyltransferase [candidate division Zixibacteria bacterium]|nr:class I SAM-dependent methyltransferase [Candidatus Tariuqbacter arcticus]